MSFTQHAKTFLEAHHPLVKFEEKHNDEGWRRATKSIESDMSEMDAMTYYLNFLDGLIESFPETTLCLDAVRQTALDDGRTLYFFSFWFKI